VTRTQVRTAATEAGIDAERLLIPHDGERLTFAAA